MYKKPAYHKWYGLARWKKLRRRQLAASPLCCMCKDEGFIRPASVVDHVQEHKGDLLLFWDEENLQSLCKRHHDSDKQSAEKGGSPKIRVDSSGWPMEAKPSFKENSDELFYPFLSPSAIPLTLVYGPPAAGKTTYVDSQSNELDIVIDLDAIIFNMFGVSRTTEWIKRRSGLRDRNRQLRELSKLNPHSRRKAWFITTIQDPIRLEHWKKTIKPTNILLLEEPTQTLIDRVHADKWRREYAASQVALIKEWKANHKSRT